MNEKLYINLGDVIKANLHGLGVQDYVITQTMPPCVDRLTIDETSGEKRLKPVGTLSGPIKVLGRISVEEIIEGQGRGWFKLDDALRNELRSVYEEILETGPTEYQPCK